MDDRPRHRIERCEACHQANQDIDKLNEMLIRRLREDLEGSRAEAEGLRAAARAALDYIEGIPVGDETAVARVARRVEVRGRLCKALSVAPTRAMRGAG
jgi:hypothetical protein